MHVSVCLQIAVESGPFADYERELVAALPDWQQQYAIFTVLWTEYAYNKMLTFRSANFLLVKNINIRFSALLLVPTTGESVALTPPLPIALYENGERLADVERALCLPSLPSVAGIVCVSQAWRHISRNTLDKHWLERVKDALVEQMCAEIEELNDTEYTTIMLAVKPQLCVRLYLLLILYA